MHGAVENFRIHTHEGFSVQKSAADPISWANALRKFASINAELVVVWGDALLQMACREKTGVPLVFGFVMKPELCSCARTSRNPSGNAVGASFWKPPKTLLAKARLMAQYRTVGVLALPDDGLGQDLAEELRGMSKELGFTVTLIPVPRREAAAAAFRASPDIGLLFMPTYPLPAGQYEELLAVASERHVLTVALQPPRGKAAALLSLYESPEEQGRLTAEVAVAILRKGILAAPATPLAAKKIEFLINMPLAKQLGVRIPMALLETATKIIK